MLVLSLIGHAVDKQVIIAAEYVVDRRKTFIGKEQVLSYSDRLRPTPI